MSETVAGFFCRAQLSPRSKHARDIARAMTKEARYFSRYPTDKSFRIRWRLENVDIKRLPDRAMYRDRRNPRRLCIRVEFYRSHCHLHHHLVAIHYGRNCETMFSKKATEQKRERERRKEKERDYSRLN